MSEKVFEFVNFWIIKMVQDPESVEISMEEVGEDEFLISIQVPEEDKGRVIGRGGATIDALRHLAHTMSARDGGRVKIKVLE